MVDLEQARNKLNGLLQQQRETFSQDPNRVSPSDSYSPRRILKAFPQTRDFSNIYNEAVDRFSQPMTPEEVSAMKGRLMGGLSQALSFAILHAQLPNSQELLSPANTLEFFKFLYPDTPIVEYPFGLSSLRSVSVPDGIVLQELRRSPGNIRIEEIYEYTLSRCQKYEDHKRGMFKHQDRHIPHLLKGIPRTLVTPARSPHEKNHKRTPGHDLLPVNYTHIQDLLTLTFEEYRPDNVGLTLQQRVLKLVA